MGAPSLPPASPPVPPTPPTRNERIETLEMRVMYLEKRIENLQFVINNAIAAMHDLSNSKPTPSAKSQKGQTTPTDKTT